MFLAVLPAFLLWSARFLLFPLKSSPANPTRHSGPLTSTFFRIARILAKANFNSFLLQTIVALDCLQTRQGLAIDFVKRTSVTDSFQVFQKREKKIPRTRSKCNLLLRYPGRIRDLGLNDLLLIKRNSIDFRLRLSQTILWNSRVKIQISSK